MRRAPYAWLPSRHPDAERVYKDPVRTANRPRPTARDGLALSGEGGRKTEGPMVRDMSLEVALKGRLPSRITGDPHVWMVLVGRGLLP